MQNASFLSPTRIVIGRAAEEQVGELVRQYGGRKALIHLRKCTNM